MNYYILTYELTENYLQERGRYRAEHLGLAKEMAETGKLVLGGALDEPADKAILIFYGDNESLAYNFAKNDPYVKNGLIKKWEIRKWNAVIGSKFEN